MKVIVTHKGISIRMEGWERVWALKARIDVPVAAIDSIDYTTKLPGGRDLNFWRIPGTAIPRLFLAGTYLKRGDREFWYLRRRRHGVLTVVIKKDQLFYSKLRLSVDADTAAKVVEWWGNL